MTKGKFNIFEFLNEYQKYPCLWDKSHSSYKIKAERNLALQMILPSSGLANINELKRKIRIVRCTYNQELVKMKSITRINSNYKPKLVWFELAHSFLNKNVEENEKIETNLVLNVTESNDTTSEESYDFSQTLPFLTQCQYDENERTMLNNQQELSSSLDDAVKALKCAYSEYQESTSNEFHTFGKHVAVQLEKLPLVESLKLQAEIQSLLTQARLRTMNGGFSNPKKLFK